MAAKKSGTSVKVRVLADLPFEGRDYKPNDVVEFDQGDIDQLKSLKVLDESEGAVKYCEKELGKKAIKHEPVFAEQAPEGEAE